MGRVARGVGCRMPASHRPRQASQSTWKRYQHTISEFTLFAEQRQISELVEITRPLVEEFKVWRLGRIREKKFSRGARSIALDAAILHRVFSYAIELEMIQRNPVRLEGRPGDDPECGAQPFKAGELVRLREYAGADLLIFLVLRVDRSARLRCGSAAVGRSRPAVGRGFTRLTLKRKKRVVIPMHLELRFALESESQQRSPAPEDLVLLNPGTGAPLTRPRLYERIRALGKRAKVADAHPHRFRDTFCVDMLARGVNPYSVARIMGITVEMLERHYASFIPELRERVRVALASCQGLEIVSPASERPVGERPAKRANVE